MKKKKNTDIADGSAAVKKSRIPMILGIIAAVLLVVLIIFIVVYFFSSKRAVKKYVKAGISIKGGKNYFSMILPDYVADQLRSDDKWDDMIDSYNADNADIRDDFKFTIKNITKRIKLSDEALDGAQIYFIEIAKKYDTKPVDLDIIKGREFEIKLTRKDRESKKKTTESLVVCAVKIKGNGWKIVEISASELEKLSREWE